MLGYEIPHDIRPHRRVHHDTPAVRQEVSLNAGDPKTAGNRRIIAAGRSAVMSEAARGSPDARGGLGASGFRGLLMPDRP